MKILRILRDQPPAVVFTVGTLTLVLVGLVDWLTGWEVNLFVFYAFPIFMVAWYLGRNWGVFFALLSGGTWSVANLDMGPSVTNWGYVWAVLTRWSYFTFVAVGAAALRAQNDVARARIESLERTRELEREIVRASENVQQRIGQDLHDGLCQELAAISIAARALGLELEKTGSPETGAAHEIEVLVKQAMIEARGLARGVFPVQMDETGLLVALDELVTTTNRLVPAVASFASRGDVKITDPTVSMHLYRIAQEALSNAIKHSHAQHVEVALASEGDTIRLAVTDDGRGVAPERASTGMGLRTMTYRANSIGADIHIGPRPTGGTIVSCTMRVREPQPDQYATAIL